MNSKKKHFNIFYFIFFSSTVQRFLKQRIMSLAENLKSQRTTKKKTTSHRNYQINLLHVT